MVRSNDSEEFPEGPEENGPHDLSAWLAAYDQRRAGNVDISEPEALPLPPDASDRVSNACRAIDALHDVFRTAETSTPEPTETRSLGDFRIVREIGRGGMGVVYEAEQISLQRRVALKVLPFAAVLDKRLLTRFRNEALAAATLDHPNIVSIYSVGCERSVHFLAMQLVEGQSLETAIRDLRETKDTDWLPGNLARQHSAGRDSSSTDAAGEPADLAHHGSRDTYALRKATCSTRSTSASNRNSNRHERFATIASLGADLADALHYAHTNGVLHRDVKPANLLLDAGGQVYITDFGLARVENSIGLTMTGDVLGTPQYMSPEQAMGTQHVDHRTDIYSLGVTLYELLTLRPAFDGSDRQQLLKQLAFDEPPAPRKLCAKIPQDVETIVLKAIAKDRDDRYATAQELADDLRRFLEFRPIKAKPVSAARRIHKWAARHQSLVLTSLFSFAVVTVILIVSALFLANAFRDERQQRNLATASASELREHLYAADMRFATDAWQHQQFELLEKTLARYDTPTEQPDLRGFVWNFLKHQPPRPIVAVAAHLDRALDAVVGADDRLLVTCGSEGAVRFFDIGANVSPRPDLDYRHASAVASIALSPDGQWIASVSEDGRLGLRSTTDQQQPVALMEVTTNALSVVAFSPSEDLVAVGDQVGNVYVIDWRRQELRRSWSAHHEQDVKCLDFSADGSRLASGGYDGRACIWDVASGDLGREIVHQEHTRRSRVSGIAFTEEDQRLLTVSRDLRRVLMWDVQTGELVGRWPIAGEVLEGLAVSVDEELFVCVSKDGVVRVIDRHLGRGMHDFPSSVGRPLSANYSPTGNKLVVAGESGVVALYEATHIAANPQKARLLTPHTDCLYSPDGRRFATVTQTGQIHAWNTTTGEYECLLDLDSPSEEPARTCNYKISMSTSGSRVAAGGMDLGHVEVWDLERQTRLCNIPQAVGRLAMSPDGRSVATAGDEKICIWDAAVGTLTREITASKSTPMGITYSPDGQLIAASPHIKQLQIFHVEDLREAYTLDIGPAITAWAFSPDSRLLVVARSRFDCLVFDVQTGQQTGSLIGHVGDIRDMAFTADSLALATVSADETLRFWDLRKLQCQGVLHVKSPLAVSFGPDDQTLACLSVPFPGSRMIIFSTGAGKQLQLECISQ